MTYKLLTMKIVACSKIQRSDFVFFLSEFYIFLMENHLVLTFTFQDAPVGNWDGHYKGEKLCNIPEIYGLLLPVNKVSSGRATLYPPTFIIHL